MAICGVTPAMAQLDNTVEVTNEVKPVVTDVTKMPVRSQKAETQVTHYTMEYAVQDQPFDNFVEDPLGNYESEAVWKGRKKGYIHMGGGALGKLDGRVAYEFDLTDNDALDIDFSLKGFNGKVKENRFLGVEDWKSRFYKNRAALKYNHRFSNGVDFFAKGAFENHVFNYMGNTLRTDKQHDVLANAVVGFTPYASGRFTVEGSAGVKFFSQNHLFNLRKELGETVLHLDASASYSLTDNQGIGLDLGGVHSHYGNEELKGETRLFFTPHYMYENDEMALKLGVFVSNTGHVAPDARLTFHLDSNSDVYVGARGYEEDNDFRRLHDIHPYFSFRSDAETELVAEFHQIDAFVGYRFGKLNGLSGDVNAGYDYSTNSPDMASMEFAPDGRLFHQTELSKNRRFYINADFTYAYGDVLKIVAHHQLNIEKGKTADKWEKGSFSTPAFEMDWKLDAKLVNGLYAGIDWNFANYTNAADSDPSTPDYNRPNTVNLGASLRYTLPIQQPVTLFVKGDNLLNQKYDRYFGYRNIGTNFLAGFAMSF